ncbi:MAG: dihydroorotate dehydrogenase [Oscillospiraceae bacterium]
MVNTSVSLAGLTLKNPVIPASGCFGYGHEFAELYPLDLLGAIAIKGTTAEPRFGNPTPRIAETASGLLNSVGLQNPGLDAVIEHELPALGRVFSGPIIANVSGFEVEEYIRCAERLDAQPGVSIIEVNISCPNVHGGGLAFGTDPCAAFDVTRAVKRIAKKPVFVKLSPNVSDIVTIAKACADAGADGLTLINTLLGMRIDLASRKPLLANVTGGLSGPAVLPVALRMVWQVFKAVRLPIIGCGGVSSAEDVIEMLSVGASAVEIGAANLKNPFACKEIIEALPAAMERLGIENLSDITGAAHEG